MLGSPRLRLTNAERKSIEDDLAMIKNLLSFNKHDLSEANSNIIEAKINDFMAAYGTSELKVSDYKIENKVMKHRISLTWTEIS